MEMWNISSPMGAACAPKDFPDLGGAKRIDLFLGDRSSLPGLIRLRVVLELKGPKSAWPGFLDDLARLRQIKQVVSGEEQAAVFAYLTCPLLDGEREKHDRQLEKWTNLKLSDFKVLDCLRNCVATDGVRRASVYIHILR
jgi:hypothetical protein